MTENEMLRSALQEIARITKCRASRTFCLDILRSADVARTMERANLDEAGRKFVEAHAGQSKVEPA